jgi:hypothetical protein
MVYLGWWSGLEHLIFGLGLATKTKIKTLKQVPHVIVHPLLYLCYFAVSIFVPPFFPRYEIKKDGSGMFGIDRSFGTLSVLSPLDDLITPAEFTLIVEAKDLGEQPLKSQAKVSVRIESGDACIFEKPSYTVQLAENAFTDKVFKKLHARCPNGKPVFTIVSGDNYSQFECNVNSGEFVKYLIMIVSFNDAMVWKKT